MNRIVTKTLYPIRPCTFVYIVLMGLTLVTWMIGKSGMAGLEVSLIVLGFALIKGLLIGDYYMGLRGIKSIWRWVIIIWLVIPGALITWAFVGAG
jgi:cytochrome c oxidase subunit 4